MRENATSNANSTSVHRSQFFCVIRAVDILKPWPCRGLQSVPGGRGIVIDDFFANLYSLAINWAILFVFFR